MNYQLDFSHLTIGDVAPVLAHHPSGLDVLVFADKVVVGGIMHLPLAEAKPIVDLVTEQFAMWAASNEYMKWMAGK